MKKPITAFALSGIHANKDAHYGIQTFRMVFSFGKMIPLDHESISHERKENAPLFACGATHAWGYGQKDIACEFGVYRSDYGDREIEFIAYGVSMTHVQADEASMIRAALPFMESLNVCLPLRAFVEAVESHLKPREEVHVRRATSDWYMHGVIDRKLSADTLEERIMAEIATTSLGRDYIAQKAAKREKRENATAAA